MHIYNPFTYPFSIMFERLIWKILWNVTIINENSCHKAKLTNNRRQVREGEKSQSFLFVTEM